MSILLIRHAETPMNARRVMQHPDTALSERGERQARALGERLATAPLGAIVTSDYRRAHDTAAAISATTGLALDFDETLRERNFGELRGRAYDTFETDPFAEDYQPPGGENWAQFYARVDAAWPALVARAATVEGDLAVVTHGLVLRALCERNVGLPADADPLALVFLNTSMTVVQGPPWGIGLLACARHLDGDLLTTGARA